MTAIDLPDSPTLNQIVTSGNRSWKWDGAKWVNGSKPAGFAVSEIAPTIATTGDMWFSSTDAKIYVYYDATWIEMSPAVEGPAGPTGATGPAGPAGTFSSTQTIGMLASGLTLSSADAGKLFLNSGSVTVTVQGLSVGQQVDFVQTNAGQITFAAGSGMTLNSKGGLLKTAAQYSPATIKCIGTDSYVLLGDLGA